MWAGLGVLMCGCWGDWVLGGSFGWSGWGCEERVEVERCLEVGDTAAFPHVLGGSVISGGGRVLLGCSWLVG